MTNCTNCNHPVTDKFCPHCGQAVQLKRIDSHYISHEIQHLLHVEKGFFYTIRELFFQPGSGVREYLTENRKKFIKPIPFLIFTSLLYTLVNSYFHIEESMVVFDDSGLGQPTGGKSTAMSLIAWIQGHYGYSNIMMGGVIALFLKLFFRKHHYNLFEISVLLCFIMGEAMLLLALLSIVAGLTKSGVVFTVMGVVTFVYTTWAIGQFYGQDKKRNFLKALVAYVLGMVAFYAIVIVIGLLIDHFRH